MGVTSARGVESLRARTRDEVAVKTPSRCLKAPTAAWKGPMSLGMLLIETTGQTAVTRIEFVASGIEQEREARVNNFQLLDIKTIRPFLPRNCFGGRWPRILPRGHGLSVTSAGVWASTWG